jgi:hypothetical protein
LKDPNWEMAVRPKMCIRKKIVNSGVSNYTLVLRIED